MQRLNGTGVSPGLVAGPALLVTARAADIRFRVGEAGVERQLGRLSAAVDASRHQLEEIRERIARVAGPETARLFDVQILLLDDPMLAPRAATLIRVDGINAEWALQRACDELGAVFDDIEDPYLRERQGDVADVVGRIRLNMRGGGGQPLRARFDDLAEPHVLIADQLSPSIAAQIDWTRVLGFATDTGSWTYHTAILARSLGVPAVVGLRDLSRHIQPGTLVALDGSTGEVIIDPVLPIAEPRLARKAPASVPEFVSWKSAETANRIPVRLLANIDLIQEVPDAKQQGAQGIGLVRSEFLLGGGRSSATVGEGAQYDLYRSLLEQMAPLPVTIRTLDLTDEQFDPAAATAEPASGARGLRAIRFSMAHLDLFELQLRALLRAARHGTLRIMFPFLAGVDDWRQAKAVFDRVAGSLKGAGAVVPNVPLGAMIEVPSAVLTAHLLAREADFFSIGTNDLIEYTLAINRTDVRVSHLYDPLHPAVVRAIRMTARAARRQGLSVAVAGEMAADPLALAVLIGVGVSEFSMRPAAIPRAREVLGTYHTGELRPIVGRLLNGGSQDELRAYVTERTAAPEPIAALGPEER